MKLLTRFSDPKKIERVDPKEAVDSALLDLDKELAFRAEMELGYNALSYAMTAADAQSALVRILAEAAVKPLDTEKVRKYMQAWVRPRTADRVGFGWNIVPLAGYGKRVPQYALKLALDVRAASARLDIAGATPSKLSFLVHELQQIPDPFLSVSVTNKLPYLFIAVWDEPTFKP